MPNQLSVTDASHQASWLGCGRTHIPFRTWEHAPHRITATNVPIARPRSHGTSSGTRAAANKKRCSFVRLALAARFRSAQTIGCDGNNVLDWVSTGVRTGSKPDSNCVDGLTSTYDIRFSRVFLAVLDRVRSSRFGLCKAHRISGDQRQRSMVWSRPQVRTTFKQPPSDIRSRQSVLTSHPHLHVASTPCFRTPQRVLHYCSLSSAGFWPAQVLEAAVLGMWCMPHEKVGSCLLHWTHAEQDAIGCAAI